MNNIMLFLFDFKEVQTNCVIQRTMMGMNFVICGKAYCTMIYTVAEVLIGLRDIAEYFHGQGQTRSFSVQ